MKRLGIAVKNLGANELAWRLIKQANTLTNIDIIFFCESIVKPCLPTYNAVMNLAEMWSFTGPVVATHINGAEILINAPGPSNKSYYLWDLDWMRESPREYKKMKNVFSNPKLKYISRNEEHALLLYQLWGSNASLRIHNASIRGFLNAFSSSI